MKFRKSLYHSDPPPTPHHLPMILLNDHPQSIDLQQALADVSQQRRLKALHYHFERDQKLSLAVYLLLCEALSKQYGITDKPEFVFGPNGKPLLKDYPHINFNLSHCDYAALCVVSDEPVGCDVETVPSHLDIDLCRQCHNEKEIGHILRSDNPPLAFTTLWTQKEAFLKLTGQGLIDNLPELLQSPQAQKVRFHTHIAPDKTYVYTVCTSYLVPRTSYHETLTSYHETLSRNGNGNPASLPSHW